LRGELGDRRIVDGEEGFGGAVPADPRSSRIGGAGPPPDLRRGLRGAILDGRLQAGTQVPSTRTLAAGLGVARTTVVIAFSQLLAEGYLEGRVGSGTYVSPSMPDRLRRARVARGGGSGGGRRTGAISNRGLLFTSSAYL
jgi:hypothetical protein